MYRLVVVAGLIAAVLAVFVPVLSNDFIDYDDGVYVTDNPRVREGVTLDGFGWAWTTTHAANWHPVTWLSHMLDWRLYGDDAAGHHLTSLLLHLLNTLLLFRLLEVTTGATGKSAFAAALFAVHPIHVESVAWIAERKDVLSTAFWLLTTLAYVAWTRRPAPWRYAAIVTLFALGLASKPMLVTLPFTLLLLDFWPLDRTRGGFRPLVWEKLPLFVLAGASCVVTFLAQRSGEAVGSLTHYPLAVRLSNAIVSYAGYLFKTVWPRDLAVFYPHPGDTTPLWVVVVALLAISGITFAALREARSRPYFPVGWLWYLGTLVPVIGLVQVGRQAMADRYTYVPLIGIFVIAAWGIAEAVPRRRLLPVTALIAVAALMVSARIQVGHWKNTRSLFAHTIRVAGSSGLAHNNLGIALAREGRSVEAMAQYRKAIEIDPHDAKARNNLGALLAGDGRPSEAVEQYEEALRLAPAYPEAHHNLALALVAIGSPAKAVIHYREALRANPGWVEAHNNLGIALAQLSRTDEAIVHFGTALRLDPGHEKAHLNWGLAVAARGEWDEAAAHFAEAVRIRPASGEAHYHLAVALYFREDYAGAWREIREAAANGYEPPPRFLVDLSERLEAP